jgi:hypothetical protein
MRRVRLVLAVALAMVALMLAVSPAMAHQHWWDDGDRGNWSDHGDWNDRDRDHGDHGDWRPFYQPFCSWYPIYVWGWFWGWSYWCWNPWWGWWQLW